MAQLYEKPVTLLMHDMVDSLAPLTGQEFTKRDAVDWFRARYPKVKISTLVAHLAKKSTNDPIRRHYGARPVADDLLVRTGVGRYRKYDPTTDPEPIGYAQKQLTLSGTATLPEEADSEEQNDPTESDGPEKEDGGREFAYERDLRNYLAKNISLIEPGLRLYDDGEGITGVEFPVGGRRIDILAVDQNHNYVVVELKVSQAYDRVVGQLLRYMGWIQQHHADPGESVRGVIIANEISNDLRLACAPVPDVKLFRYSLSVSLDPVAIRTHQSTAEAQASTPVMEP